MKHATEEQRFEALKKYFMSDDAECPYSEDEAEQIRYESYDNDGRFNNVGDADYFVLTDDEADAMARECILDSLWAFRSEFIAEHTAVAEKSLSINQWMAFVKSLEKMQEILCEESNEIIKALINDLDAFVDDAVTADGRGAFLAMYDNEEHEILIDGTWYYIYKN